FGIPGVREYGHWLYDLEDARALRNHTLRALEHASVTTDAAERARLLTFVIVGAGPTGVEMAGALAEFRRHVLPRDYRHIDPAEMRIIVIEAGPHPPPPFPEKLRARALRDLGAFGVDVRTNTRVERVTADAAVLAGGGLLPTETVIRAARIRGAPVVP